MAIQNITGMKKEILDNYDSAKWIKNAEFKLDELKTDLSPLQENDNDKEVSFGRMLADSLKNVNELQKKANVEIQKLVSGESKNLHKTMLAVEKAEIAFKLINQVRSKVIDAYKEIMRMQV